MNFVITRSLEQSFLGIGTKQEWIPFLEMGKSSSNVPNVFKGIGQ